MIRIRISALFFLLVSLVSCDDKQQFDKYITVSGSWDESEKVEFILPQLDSIQQYNLFINIRNNNKYHYSNLFLISEIRFPNGKVVTDTLEYQMANPDGSWLGAGFTDVKENKLWYKENVSFREEGIYKVEIQHAMRKNGKVSGINTLEGITDIGFRIEKAHNP